MSAASYVDDARRKTRLMIALESRGAGDTRGAMERLSRRYAIDFNALWSLRYRPPKRLAIDVYVALCDAHQTELDRQSRRLDEERKATKPATLVGRYLVRTAAAVGGSEGAALNGGEG